MSEKKKNKAIAHPKVAIFLHGLNANTDRMALLQKAFEKHESFNDNTIHRFYSPEVTDTATTTPEEEAQKHWNYLEKNDFLQKNAQFFLFGHSRGGLVATILATMLEKKGFQVVYVIAYGTPFNGVNLINNAPVLL
jgi:triacylglycerol esterase/lipase EstA (alpha/beta hydrolase family)